MITLRAIIAALVVLASACARPAHITRHVSATPAPRGPSTLWLGASYTCAHRAQRFTCIGDPDLGATPIAVDHPGDRFTLLGARLTNLYALTGVGDPSLDNALGGRADALALPLDHHAALALRNQSGLFLLAPMEYRLQPFGVGGCACFEGQCRCGARHSNIVEPPPAWRSPPAARWNDDLCTLDASGSVRCVATSPPSGGVHLRPRDPREELLFDRSVREVSAGLESLCARRIDDAIECVRRDRSRYVVSFSNRAAPAQLATSLDEHCALSDNGDVSCWREGVRAIEPARLVFSGPSDARDPHLRAGLHHACVAFERGASTEVWCWGDASIARTGSMHTLVNEPTLVALPGAAVRIDVGGAHSCAQLASGDVYCWGNNTEQQIRPLDASLAREPLERRFVAVGEPSLVARGVAPLVTGYAATCWCASAQRVGAIDASMVSADASSTTRRDDASECTCIGAHPRDDRSMSGPFVVARGDLAGSEWSRCDRTRAALQTLGVAFDALECSEQHACLLRNGEVACFGSNTWFQSAPTALRGPRLTMVVRQ